MGVAATLPELSEWTLQYLPQAALQTACATLTWPVVWEPNTFLRSVAPPCEKLFLHLKEATLHLQ